MHTRVRSHRGFASYPIDPCIRELSGEVIGAISRSDPQTMAQIRQAIAEKRIGLIGGEASETRLPRPIPADQLEQDFQ